MADFEIAIPKLLLKEGGPAYTNIAGDNGGETKYGISKAAYPKEDIKNLTEARARELYWANYWDICLCSKIDSQLVAEAIFESAVNMGTKTTAKIVQLVAGVTVDGQIGMVTVAAINTMGEQNFLLQFKLAVIARYAHLCNQDRTQNKFLLGWINRALGGVQ